MRNLINEVTGYGISGFKVQFTTGQMNAVVNAVEKLVIAPKVESLPERSGLEPVFTKEEQTLVDLGKIFLELAQEDQSFHSLDVSLARYKEEKADKVEK